MLYVLYVFCNKMSANRNYYFFTTYQHILCCTLLANSLSIPALLRISSFLSLSIRDTHTTSQTLHLMNIHFPSLSTSHTPCLCSVQPRLYSNSFILTLIYIYPHNLITQHTFQRSPGFINPH